MAACNEMIFVPVQFAEVTDFFPGGGVKKEGLKHWDLMSLCFAPSHPLEEFTVVQVSGFVLSNL